MDPERKVEDDKMICEICGKDFCSVSTINRHLKVFHGLKKEEKKSRYIICPLCPKEKKEPFSCHVALKEHLITFHSISIKETILNFRNLEEFESWRGLENREENYACERRKLNANGDQIIYYICNRSDYKGFVSVCKKRSLKCGGTIHIAGICPSRIVVKINKDEGTVMVKYSETHVGHADELRNKRLTKSEQQTIADKLSAGVTKDTNKDEDVLVINEATTSRVCYKEELAEYMEKKSEERSTNNVNFEEKRKLAAQEISNFTNSLDEKNLNDFLNIYKKFRNSNKK